MLTVSVLGGASSYAHDQRQVRMKFAGSLLLNVEQQQVDTQNVPTGMTELIAISQTKAKGNLGSADVKSVSKTQGHAPVPDPACPEGFLKVADINENAIIFTFRDLSLLYGDGTGVVCLNFTDFSQYASIDGIWTGGTKRFRNADGEFSIVIDRIVGIGHTDPDMGVFSTTQFSAETGRVTGYLN